MDTKQFKPAWWLRNTHLQTIWPTVFRGHIKGLQILRERIELPDGDFVDIDWVNKEADAPIVLILHGFEGSIDSHYAKGILRCVTEHGWRGAFMHFRGCSGEPNRLVRGYHSGETRDVDFIVRYLNMREKKGVKAAIGYSLGGNILLKWLGETAAQNPLRVAIAISVPFDLHKASRRMESGLSRLYQWYLVKYARQRLIKKFRSIKNHMINADMLTGIRSLKEYDTLYTVPVHGFSSVDEYYSVTSCRYYLRGIAIPTLLLHAKDDPFMTEDTVPEPHEMSSSVSLELSDMGGHVGFVTGTVPWRAEYWLEKRIPEFLKQHI